MTDATVDQSRNGQAYQWGVEAIEETFHQSPNGRIAYSALSHLITSSVPVHPRGPGSKRRASCSRAQDRLCGKTSGKLSPSPKTAKETDPCFPKRSYHPSAGGVFEKRASWHINTNVGRLSMPTTSIACPIIELTIFISFCYPRSVNLMGRGKHVGSKREAP